MNIFLSYASEETDIAEAIEVALRGEGHIVFRDRSSLPSGDAYHERIRAAIEESDLFLFLVSPESVGAGRYTLNELDLAKARWSNPANHILPVIVRPTDKAAIPVYLKAVTWLEPRGNVPAAVTAAVARVAAPPWHGFVRRWAPVLVVIVLAAIVGTGFAVRRALEDARIARTVERQIAEILEAGRLQHKSGRYAQAWDDYAQALLLAPGNSAVALGQERVAIDWLDNISVEVGKETLTSIAEKVQPVLVRCAGSTDLRRSADCVAHLGWGEYLRKREGQGDGDPVRHYRRALEVDPMNVYAHAMWGHYLLASVPPFRGLPGRIVEARSHFDQALASGREREYVRRLQIAGLLWSSQSDSENEAIRIANDMRVNGEPSDQRSNQTSSVASRFWNVYYGRVVRAIDQQTFLAAIPAADHIATFRWLYPDEQIPNDKRTLYLFVLGVLQEHAGDRLQALTTFETIRGALARDGTLNSGGPLPDGTRAAIKRLSK